jgi:N utilization substance protein B
MTARRRARRRALEILYEAELRGLDPLGTLRERSERGQPPVPPYTATLVEGVVAHRERIDELLATYAEGWPLERMPPVDRNLLRLGAYELLWEDDVPDVVSVDEAVALAEELSTEQSPAFVNGLLARLLDLKPTLTR